MKTTNTFLKVLGCLYIPIAIACLITISWFMYYFMFLKDNTLAIQSNFMGNAAYTDEDTYFMEVQVFPNVVEVKINYYVDTNIPEQNEDGSFDTKYMMSSGVQFYSANVRDVYKISRNRPIFSGYNDAYVKLKNCTYYTTTEGQNTGYVSGGSTIANENEWLYDIGGQLCAVKSKGRVKIEKVLWTTYYNIFDISSLIVQNYNAFQSFKDGTTIQMFNFSKYFNIMMDDGNGHFTKEVTDENILREWTFVDVKVTTNSREMISSKQSLFGSYKGNTEWNADGTQDGDSYWTDYTTYDLTVKDFKFVNCINGYEIEIKSSCVGYLNEFENVIYNVNLDLDEIDEVLKIVGFTEKPFRGLLQTLGEIKITSSTPRTFNIYSPYEIETVNVSIIQGGA